MKCERWSYLLLLLTGVLCACGRESVPDTGSGEPILFRAGMNLSAVATKADDPDAPTKEDYLIADGRRVGVYATWTSTSGAATDVFSKIPLTCTDNGPEANPRYTWDYTPHKYWRTEGSYDFRAVFPMDVHTQFGTGGTRMVASYSMLSENYDLLVAGSKRNLDAGEGRSTVALDFKHACAAVRVLFQDGSTDPYRHYYLDSFEMQHLKAVGVLVYEGGVPSLASWNPSEYRTPSVMHWEAPDEAGRILIPDKYEDFKKVTQSDWVQWHFVIPQELNVNDGNKPAIRYSVDVEQYLSDGTLAYKSSLPIYTTLKLPLTYNDGGVEREVVWEPGKMYTYYVQIQAGSVYITISVEDWDSYYVYVEDVIFG